VGLPSIVESGGHLDVERDPSAHASQQPNQAMLFAGRRAGPRHEIEQFTDPLLRQKPRDEDRRVGKVELLRGERFVERPGTEVTAAGMVRQRREDAGRVEAWTAEPIEGAVRCDQRPAVCRSPMRPWSAINGYSFIWATSSSGAELTNMGWMLWSGSWRRRTDRSGHDRGLHPRLRRYQPGVNSR
jgi:hypothetical protein